MRADVARFLDTMNKGEIALLAEVIDRRIGAAAKAVEPYRALVAAGTGTGLVTLQTLDDVAPRDEEFARLDTGVMLYAGDEVVCVDVAGKPFVLGRVRRTDGLPEANVVLEASADTTDYTNTSTTTPADAATIDVAVPPGTWSLYGIASIVASHSAVSSNMRTICAIDGSAGSESAVAAIPTQMYTGVSTKRATGVTGGRNVAITARFYSATAGTMTVWVSHVALWGRRTG